ncbi:MAG: glycosyltransferase [Gammaproteobacteria bacterium]|nr:glycosyltransferase [Gammaproteobacteria bacterium]
MFIAQLSKADRSGGGASRVAEDLTSALLSIGHNVVHFASYASNGFNNIRYPLYGSNRWLQYTIRKSHNLSRRIGVAEILPLEMMPLWQAHISDFDLLHFHDITSAISPLTLAWLSRNKPVVWTIHDCSVFTGGCLYPMECIAYKSHCHNCPQIGTWPLDSIFDGTHLMQTVKMRLHATKRIRYVAPSEWMSKIAFESGKLPVAPDVITNGVDTETYKPVADRHALRSSLGLPDDGMMFIVSAGHLRDPRKGIHLALKAIRSLTAEFNPWVLLVGAMNEEDKYLFDGLRWIATGYINDPVISANYYAAADAFLFCSLADNQPLAVLESLSSGTPVIGFASEEITKMVPDDICGQLVPTNDLHALIVILRRFLRGEIGQHWPQQARSIIEKKHSIKIHLQAHINLYNSLINSHLSV